MALGVTLKTCLADDLRDEGRSDPNEQLGGSTEQCLSTQTFYPLCFGQLIVTHQVGP